MDGDRTKILNNKTKVKVYTVGMADFKPVGCEGKEDQYMDIIN